MTPLQSLSHRHQRHFILTWSLGRLRTNGWHQTKSDWKAEAITLKNTVIKEKTFVNVNINTPGFGSFSGTATTPIGATEGSGAVTAKMATISFPHFMASPSDTNNQPSKFYHASHVVPAQITCIGAGHPSQYFTTVTEITSSLKAFTLPAVTPSSAKTSSNANYKAPSQIHSTLFEDYGRWRNKVTLNQDLEEVITLLANLQVEEEELPWWETEFDLCSALKNFIRSQPNIWLEYTSLFDRVGVEKIDLAFRNGWQVRLTNVEKNLLKDKSYGIDEKNKFIYLRMTVSDHAKKVLPSASWWALMLHEALSKISISSWKITRKGLPTATVESYGSGSIADLANEIGLMPGEWKEWLTFSGSGKVKLANGSEKLFEQLDVNDVLAKEQTGKFEIPNTILMAWFGDLGARGENYMSWENNAADLVKLGFHVEYFNIGNKYATASAAEQAFLTQLNSLSVKKQLHGLYMMGHGNDEAIACKGKLWSSGTKAYIYYITPDPGFQIGDGTDSIGGKIKYHLGAVIAHACESSDGDAYSLATPSTDGGIFDGKSGYYIPKPERIALLWGEKIRKVHNITRAGVCADFEWGGKQGTETFGIVGVRKL